ncbi:uncharacterized protein LOC131679075 [Topomyia yanbarensis]|uniref:uncharacterized protein LOC131679075 n=1 Tax=Topomyia yanbarensis TaxID=2498891 RepID=UPI00273C9454|nr:uncharacterized protein LOC131679075 [Topomyia yanbarensis]
MYEIVSCAENTRLHTFPALERLCTIAHPNSNGSDCHFFPAMKLFLRTNKNFGVEMMRIDEVDGRPTIVNVGKIGMQGLNCVACPKLIREDIAMGSSSGLIRLLNYRKITKTKRLEPDRLTDGVTSLDYNTTDDVLAVAYQSGMVNLYGMKNHSREATIKLDATKARFHPTNLFLLSVASKTGAVMMYDTESKKITYIQLDAHGTSCREIIMAASRPDTLFSIGYDNVMNIFDTRKKLIASQISSRFSFESLAVSECGGFFCTGNRNGEVYGYDMRYLVEPIKIKAIHTGVVNSIAFVPKPIRREKSRLSLDHLQFSKSSEVTVKTVLESTFLCPDLGSGQDSYQRRRHSMGPGPSRKSAEPRVDLNVGYLDDNLDLDKTLRKTDQARGLNIVKSVIEKRLIMKQPCTDRIKRSAVTLENILEVTEVDGSRTLTEISPSSNKENLKRCFHTNTASPLSQYE